MRRIGVVLAGGKSSRMGQDKALLEYHGQTLLQHTEHTLQSCCDEVWISGRQHGRRAVQDRFPGRGPVAAIHAVCDQLRVTGINASVVFVPVDMPLLQPALLDALFDHDAPVVCYQAHPLPAVVNNFAAVATIAASMLVDGSSSVRTLWQRAFVRMLPVPTNAFDQFTNANTPEQWRQICRPPVLCKEY